MSKNLNLGCGNNIKKGWVNLDCTNLPGVDIVHDLNKLPLPFIDEEFECIRCDNILEHVEYLPLMEELHRILKKGGVLRIRVPHFTSRNNFVDPTHKKCFSIDTFDFFVKNITKNDYYFNFHFEHIRNKRISFLKSGIYWNNRFIELIINMNSGVQRFYENSFLCRIFPANDVIVELIK
jgi:SAM-dependent methyltransferase